MHRTAGGRAAIDHLKPTMRLATGRFWASTSPPMSGLFQPMIGQAASSGVVSSMVPLAHRGFEGAHPRRDQPGRCPRAAGVGSAPGRSACPGRRRSRSRPAGVPVRETVDAGELAVRDQ
jgi:hypothetical protein